MTKRIRVTAIRRPEPDIRLYVLALIELARQLQEADNAEAAHGRPVMTTTAEEDSDV